MKIGDLNIENPVILAPMAGVTDLPFRKLVHGFGGVGFTVSEMIASHSTIQNSKKSLRKCEKVGDNILSVQIAGCDPDIMSSAAKLNEDMGADIIDINFGCPVKKVVKSFAGSALMKDEELSAKIIKSVVNAVKIPVTVKMRLGWSNDNRNAPKLAKIAEDLGVKMIAVHGRTRSQMYEGNADWKAIYDVKNAINIPVVANGDIRTPEDAKECLEESGADGVMIGRGCYGKPYLIRQISDYLRTSSYNEYVIDKTMILSHFRDVILYYGEERGVQIAKKHIGWYSTSMNGSAEFRNKINRSIHKDDIEKLIQEFFK